MDEGLLLRSGQALDPVFTLHGREPIGEGLPVDQFHGPPTRRVLRTLSSVVGGQPLF